MRRRSLLQWIAAAVSALPGLRAFAATPFSSSPIPTTPAPTDALPANLTPESEATLRGLATVVLPPSLGPERIDEIVDRFRAWLRAYRPGAELDHGYGHTKLRATAASPLLGYARQLAALDRAARAEGQPFARLAPERQRSLVGAALAASEVADLPERPDGRHVAADLLAFFFRGSEASDLCYGKAIGRDQCRGLPGSENPPAPLKANG
jgi:hypothetical protein